MNSLIYLPKKEFHWVKHILGFAKKNPDFKTLLIEKTPKSLTKGMFILLSKPRFFNRHVSITLTYSIWMASNILRDNRKLKIKQNPEDTPLGVTIEDYLMSNLYSNANVEAGIKLQKEVEEELNEEL